MSARSKRIERSTHSRNPEEDFCKLAKPEWNEGNAALNEWA